METGTQTDLNLPRAVPAPEYYTAADRSKTTYAEMNSWHAMQGKDMSTGGPVMRQEFNWQPVDPKAFGAPTRHGHLSARDSDFAKKYWDLYQNIRYRHPDPGPPRQHDGRIGGHWRHIREVGGYGTSQVVFVDGLVRLYDNDQILNPLRREHSMQAKVATPQYALNRHDVGGYQRALAAELQRRDWKGADSLHKLPPIPEARMTSPQRALGSPRKLGMAPRSPVKQIGYVYKSV